MSPKYKVLIAEDEKILRNIIKNYLTEKNFEVDATDNGIDACKMVDSKVYDIIVLDIMMPGKDGRETCKYIRNKYDVPVIFLTALDKEEEIITCYEIGADEYMTKPFSMAVLYAKLCALIKRYHGLNVQNGLLQADEITIIPSKRQVSVNGTDVMLAPKEYDLLIYFLDNKNQILNRDQILNAVWGMEYEGYDRAVDTHIKKLRAALGTASYHIETVIKVGYMWK